MKGLCSDDIKPAVRRFRRYLEENGLRASTITEMLPGGTLTKIHLGNCLANNCPYRDTLRPMIEKLTGVEVITGTHLYKSADIFKPVSVDKK